jgi:site-specific recombinase XerC
MPRTETRERGLYKNGNLWWVRVRGPISRVVRPRSTGYAELRDANRVARKLEELADERTQWEWLEKVVAGEVELRRVYDHAAAGTLHVLRDELVRKTEHISDADVEPWVSTWETEHLALQSISAGQKADYVRQVRALIPEGVPFPRSAFTEDKIKSTLLSRKDTRTGLPISSSTRRRYLVAWELFYRYARKRVPLTVNPFEDVEEWRPANGSPRSTFWDHDTRIAVLDRMSGEPRAAMALVLGTGIELAALQALTHADVGSEKERTIVAHGGKNQHRENRTVFVDKWAWKALKKWLPLGTPNAPVFTLSEADLREAFYEAQVAQGLIAEPETSELQEAVEGGEAAHDPRRAPHLRREPAARPRRRAEAGSEVLRDAAWSR